MRYVAAVPAAALVAGAALGLVFPDVPRAPAAASMLLFAALAACAWRRGLPLALAASVASVFFAGGTLLAADAWQRAWRPPLRVAFEALAREARAQAAVEQRRLPEDDEAFAIVEG